MDGDPPKPCLRECPLERCSRPGRAVAADHDPRLVARARAVNDRDRARRVMEGCCRHRPENRARQRASTPGADHQEVPVGGQIDQRAGRVASDHAALDLDPRAVPTDQLDVGVERRGRVLAQLGLEHPVRRNHREARRGEGRDRPHVDDAQLRSRTAASSSAKRSASRPVADPSTPTVITPVTSDVFLRTRAPPRAYRPAPARSGSRPRHRLAAATRRRDRRSRPRSRRGTG